MLDRKLDVFHEQRPKIVDHRRSALENGPWLWQSNQFYANGGFFTMCDFIEVSVLKAVVKPYTD